MGWRVPIVKKRKFLGFLDKNNILGNLVAFMFFFFDFGSKSGSGRGWDMETQNFENFSNFWRKNDSRDFAGIYTFLTVPYQNRKNIVNFSSLWLNTRFWEPWLHVRLAYVFS